MGFDKEGIGSYGRMHWVEINGGIKPAPATGPVTHWNFATQAYFHGDLNLDIGLYKDTEGTKQLCEDSRVATFFRNSDCVFQDKSAALTSDSWVGGRPTCARPATHDPSGYGLDWCTNMFGAYVATRVKANINGAWVGGSRSVGMSNAGFHAAKFSDGTIPSTANGREGNGGAFTYECAEVPCLKGGRANPVCTAAGYVSVGDSGFNIRCSDGDVAALFKIVFCPNDEKLSNGSIGERANGTRNAIIHI